MKRMSGSNRTGKSFSRQELAVAAGLVRQSMVDALPDLELCTHEFSPEFRAKMDRLFAKERVQSALHTVRRYAAAVILLILFSAGAVLAVDAEARANFFEWVRKVYENSIVYEFFGGAKEEGLPTYGLGWVPEGYEAVDVYQDDTMYSAIYMKVDDPEAMFVFEYRFVYGGALTELIGDMSKYECKQLEIDGIAADFYLSLDPAETNHLIWINEKANIQFAVIGYLNEGDMLHIAEEMFLCKTPK